MLDKTGNDYAGWDLKNADDRATLVTLVGEEQVEDWEKEIDKTPTPGNEYALKIEVTELREALLIAMEGLTDE